MRRSSCATATRSRYLGKGVQQAVDAVNGEIADALLGLDAEDQARYRPRDDRARRHRQQGPARRQRDPRRQPRGRQGGGGRARAAALSLCRRRFGACAAGADDEHHQRRRACRQSDRLPGIHGHAGRRGDHRRGGALRLGDLPHAEEGPARQGPGDRGRRRGRLRAEPRLDHATRSISSWRRSRRRATSRATTSMLALDCAATEFFKNGKYEIIGEGKSSPPDEMADYLADLAPALSDPLDRGRHGRGRFRGLEGADRQDRRQGPARRRRSVRHQPEAADAWASTRASPIRCWSRSTRSAR